MTQLRLGSGAIEHADQQRKRFAYEAWQLAIVGSQERLPSVATIQRKMAEMLKGDRLIEAQWRIETIMHCAIVSRHRGRGVRVFKTKWFVRFARKERITDRTLWDAVDRADRGLIDADLGGGVIKQRVARSGQGKSGGYRTIVVYRMKTRAIFVFGFGKSGKADLARDEFEGYRELAKVYLAKSETDMDGYLAAGALTEVMDDGEED